SASSAIWTNCVPLPASDWNATVPVFFFLDVRIIRAAISPRYAVSTFLLMHSPSLCSSSFSYLIEDTHRENVVILTNKLSSDDKTLHFRSSFANLEQFCIA